MSEMYQISSKSHLHNCGCEFKYSYYIFSTSKINTYSAGIDFSHQNLMSVDSDD